MRATGSLLFLPLVLILLYHAQSTILLVGVPGSVYFYLVKGRESLAHLPLLLLLQSGLHNMSPSLVRTHQALLMNQYFSDKHSLIVLFASVVQN